MFKKLLNISLLSYSVFSLVIVKRQIEDNGNCVNEWNQCGGIGYTGSTKCCNNLSCIENSPWWSSVSIILNVDNI